MNILVEVFSRRMNFTDSNDKPDVFNLTTYVTSQLNSNFDFALSIELCIP